MANRTYHPVRGSLDRELVFIHGKVVISNAGAVTSFSGKGIENVTKTGAGDYLITFVDSYPYFVHSNLQVKGAYCDVIPAMGASDPLNKTLQFTTGDFAAQKDTAVGCEILVQVIVSNSSII